MVSVKQRPRNTTLLVDLFTFKYSTATGDGLVGEIPSPFKGEPSLRELICGHFGAVCSRHSES